MRIAVPHNTTRERARKKVEERIGQLLSQFGGHAQDLEHGWEGDTLRFKGKAKGLAVSGSAEVTDATVVIDAKLPLMAKMFEGKIREAVEREAASMFRS
jgi:Putative polyhydroxyalkanoic acid system protein (PHA_gran_rgn).